jgi:hypothetical protein
MKKIWSHNSYSISINNNNRLEETNRILDRTCKYILGLTKAILKKVAMNVVNAA